MLVTEKQNRSHDESIRMRSLTHRQHFSDLSRTSCFHAPSPSPSPPPQSPPKSSQQPGALGRVREREKEWETEINTVPKRRYIDDFAFQSLCTNSVVVASPDTRRRTRDSTLIPPSPSPWSSPSLSPSLHVEIPTFWNMPDILTLTSEAFSPIPPPLSSPLPHSSSFSLLPYPPTLLLSPPLSPFLLIFVLSSTILLPTVFPYLSLPFLPPKLPRGEIIWLGTETHTVPQSHAALGPEKRDLRLCLGEQTLREERRMRDTHREGEKGTGRVGGGGRKWEVDGKERNKKSERDECDS